MGEALPLAEQQPYLDRAEENRQRYEADSAEYSKAALEEVLVGTGGGQVSRVPVCSTVVKKRGQRGKPIVKLPARDQLCFASLLSSVEADHGDGEQQEPVCSIPARGGHGRGVGDAVASQQPCIQTVAPGTPQRSSGSARGASQTPSRSTAAAGPFQRRSILAQRRRLRHKTMPGVVSTAKRLSAGLPGQRLSSPQRVRASICKPKQRLGCKTRRSMVESRP